MTADDGVEIAGTKSPRMGFPGVGFGGSGGGGPGDTDQGDIRPPARYPLGGGGSTSNFLPLILKLVALRAFEIWHHWIVITGTIRSINKLMAHSQYF